MAAGSVTDSSQSVVFPSIGHQVLSTLVHLLGCSVLAFCFARRLSWASMTTTKIVTMGIMLDSWLFVFSGGVIVSGVGMSLNTATCLSGIWLCIVFYATSKVLIYVFLAERVFIVWSAGAPISRFKSRIWILCSIVLMGYAVIFVIMIVGKIAYIRPDKVCVIGLKGMASIPLLSYDVFLNIFLTGLFVYPLLRRRIANAGLHALAKRTCFAAGIALGTSVVNILILTLLHGHQLGWVCLASCGFDVTVNAVVIFFISRKSSGQSQPGSGVKAGHTVTDLGASVPGRPEPLAVIAGLPSIRSKKRSPPPAPVRRGSSRIASPYTSTNMHTLSAIGDFAVTRDDAGQYTTTVGSIPPSRDVLSRNSVRSNTVAFVSSSGSPNSEEDDRPFNGTAAYQSSNLMKMVPTLEKGESFTTSSLDEIDEELGSPVKPKPFPHGRQGNAQ